MDEGGWIWPQTQRGADTVGSNHDHCEPSNIKQEIHVNWSLSPCKHSHNVFILQLGRDSFKLYVLEVKLIQPIYCLQHFIFSKYQLSFYRIS